jgi:hypothetical protein
MSRSRGGVAKVLFAKASVLVLALATPRIAHAHPGYPTIVDTTLSLTSKDTVEAVLAPLGCQLCHHSSGGGDALNQFGNLMVESYGLDSNPVTEEDNSLRAALASLESGNSEAVRDLRDGIDPNTDPGVFSGSLPPPEYGCAITPGTTVFGPNWLLAFVGVLSALVVRCRRRFVRDE